MIGMASTLQVVDIKEEAEISAVSLDIALGWNDVINVRTCRMAAAELRDLAKRIPRQDKWPRSSSPLRSVI